MPSLSERRHHLLEQILQRRKMQETSANNSARTSAEGGANLLPRSLRRGYGFSTD